MIVLQNDDNTSRDNEIAAIFNPKRVRPSVVVTGESPNNNGPTQSSIVNQMTHSDSITSSQPDGAESLTGRYSMNSEQNNAFKNNKIESLLSQKARKTDHKSHLRFFL